MSTVYTARTQESNPDLDKLSDNHYNLQVAKSVSSSNGPPVYNVVYQSHFLARTMSVAWSTTYGLAWDVKVPTPGADVEHSGEWQQCDLGQSFDINEKGQWVPNQNNPNADKNSLNIGSNGYPTDVHVIVGVQDPATQKWSPIWVGPDALLKHGHGEYMPRQNIRLWFQEGTQTATMISHQGTVFQDFDMSVSNEYYFSYLTGKGKWAIPQPTPFFK